MKTVKETCLHYIGWHAHAYGAPADTESIAAILEKHYGMASNDTTKLLADLEVDKKIEFWQGKYTSGGWIIYGT